MSVSNGFLAMGKDAIEINANTFQFFTRNPRGGSAKAIDKKDIAAFLELANQHHFATLLAHAPYTLNACAADERIRKFAIETMLDDLNRMEYLPGNLYNFHPGSHVGQGVDTGINLIADALNTVLTPQQNTIVLLETMSGKGSEIGRSFEELQRIMDKVTVNEKLGVCLDTCHVYDAGYDIVESLDEVLDEFDRSIGLSRLRAVHLNDTMNDLNSHKDRHEKLTQGHFSVQTLQNIINHPALCTLPFVLETPNEMQGYAREIALLKTLWNPRK